MTQSKLDNWKDVEWTKLGSGSYNQVYISKDRKHVFKIRHAGLDAIDSRPDVPERSVRLWNEINPALPAVLAVTQYGEGWICPYVAGSSPSDEEISRSVIDIFNRTGRILADAPGKDNFKKTPEGRVVCIDVGLALQLDKRDEKFFVGTLKRSKSEVSLDTWRATGPNFGPFFAQASWSKPLTVNTVKALLFIESNRPDIFDVTFLNRSPDLITQLANGYDGQEIDIKMRALAALDDATAVKRPPIAPLPVPVPVDPVVHNSPKTIEVVDKQSIAAAKKEVDKGLQILKNERSINLKNIKESCIHELNRYISTRGAIDDKNQFNPSLITKLFRNQELTATKVGIARRLIDTIDKADTLESMLKAINDYEQVPDAKKSSFTSGLGTSLGKCILMVELAKKNSELTPTDTPSLDR